jgi:hypothetical protein
MLDMFSTAKQTYVTAAAGVSDSDFRAAIKDRGKMKALMQRMKAIDCAPSYPPATHRKPQVGPADEAAILQAIGEAREKNNTRYRLQPTADTYRDPAGLRDLSDFQVDSRPSALAEELKAIVRGLHIACDEDMLKLPVEALKPLVLQCLPSAARPIGSVTLTEAVNRIWDEQVEELVAGMSDAPAGHQAVGISDEEKTVLQELQRLELMKGKASTKLHPRFTDGTEKNEDGTRSDCCPVPLTHRSIYFVCAISSHQLASQFIFVFNKTSTNIACVSPGGSDIFYLKQRYARA